MDYIVVVTTVQKRWVSADGPVEAIGQAMNYTGDVTNEQWIYDENVKRLHVYINDEEHRIRIPKKTLALINNKLKQGLQVITDFGKSWMDMIRQDVDKLPTISLKEVAILEYQQTLK